MEVSKNTNGEKVIKIQQKGKEYAIKLDKFLSIANKPDSRTKTEASPAKILKSARDVATYSKQISLKNEFNKTMAIIDTQKSGSKTSRIRK